MRGLGGKQAGGKFASHIHYQILQHAAGQAASRSCLRSSDQVSSGHIQRYQPQQDAGQVVCLWDPGPPACEVPSG